MEVLLLIFSFLIASEHVLNHLLLCCCMSLGRQVLEMSTAASGYHKVVKENSKLYNMVQDLKG